MAMGSFPQPSGPQKSCACGTRFSATSVSSRRFTSSCPMTSLKNTSFFCIFVVLLLINLFGYLLDARHSRHGVEMNARRPPPHQFAALLDAPFYANLSSFVVGFALENLARERLWHVAVERL